MRVAITGGIGEGKSTVLKMIREAGRRTLSADDVAREIFSEQTVQTRIAQALTLSEPIERLELQARLTGDPGARRALNEITHPLIVKRLLEESDCFVEVPLLIETVLQPAFDRVWVVTCGPEEQLRRLVGRYADEERSRRLIRTQLATRAKIPFADEILRTNLPMSAVQGLVLEYLARAE